MTDYAALIGERFPVRRTKAQKQAFRDWLTAELRGLGYAPREEINGRVKARNLLAGDPEKSAVLFVAHYDTPSRWLLPDLGFPRNIPLWILWQLLHILLLLIPALAVYTAVWSLTGGNARLGLWGLVLTYAGLLCLSQFGPANPVNRGEDADPAAMLTLMASLPEEDRKKAAFLFADRGCTAGSGARAWAREHPMPAYTRLTVAFARVGGGDRLLMAATDLAVKCTGFGSLTAALEKCEGLPLTRCSTRLCTVRGDRKSFRCGVSLTACRRAPGVGLWYHGGRTPGDRRCDNVEAVSAALRAFLAGGKKDSGEQG